MAVAWVHGYSDQTGGVEALQKRLLESEYRHAEIVEWLVGVLLQFIAKAPKND